MNVRHQQGCTELPRSFLATRLAGPLLPNGPKGAWDENCAGFGSIVRTRDGLRLYYTGQQGSRTAIGIAEASDLVQWTKVGSSPIMAGDTGSWDSKRCDLPTVWVEEEEFRMIYRGVSEDNKVRVGYAESSDGITWHKHPANPVWRAPDLPWARDHCEPWGMLRHGEEYVLFFTNLYPRDLPKPTLRARVTRLLKSALAPKVIPREIGCAVSRDLIHWEPVSDKPVFRSSSDPSDWRFAQICPYVFRYRSSFYMLVISRSLTDQRTAMAAYRCPDPYFAESNRELVGTVLTSSERGWDSPLLDTPFVFTEDIDRTIGEDQREIMIFYTAGESHRLQMGADRLCLDCLQ